MTREVHNSREDQRLQALLRDALRPTDADAPPPGLADRILAATAPRLGGRSVIGRIGVAAAWWAAAACLVAAVGLSSYWLGGHRSSAVAWSTADETAIAQLAQANTPQELVEIELSSLALAVDNARDPGPESWETDDLTDPWTHSEVQIGLF